MINIIWKAEEAYSRMTDKSSEDIIRAIGEHIVKNEDLLIESAKNDEISRVSTIVIEKEFDGIAGQCNLYKRVSESFKTEDGFMFGKHYTRLGIIGAIYSGELFVTACLIARAIASHNPIILCTEKNITINKTIVELARKVLKTNDYPEDMVQIVFKKEGLIQNDLRIRTLIAVGDRETQDEVLKEASVNVVTSGYNNYEIYIEDVVDEDVIRRIINSNANIKIFVNEELKEKYEGIEIVEDIEHAISEINLRGSGFSASIMTKNRESAAKFMKNIKAKTVSINASPMIHGAFDLELDDFMRKQTLFYPF